MRVTHSSLYDASKTRLGTLVEEFNKANQEVSTGKRINNISDDPVGLSRVLALRSSLANLDQVTENIRTANTWLTEAETALGSIEGVLGDAKVLAIAMNNASMSNEERANAAVQIQEMLGQILDLANTQVNGQFLFSGTKVDTKPYAYDDPETPSEAIYSGNEAAFTLKTGRNTNIVVGYAGDDIFDSKRLTVDDTNHKIDFTEDDGSGMGAEITATIPAGTYTREEIATIIGAAMTDASAAGMTYTATYNSDKTYTFHHDGADMSLLWGSGSNAAQSIAPDIGFDPVDVSGNDLPSDNPADWSVYKTLIDLKQYLQSGSSSGIERSMTRLDTQFNNMVNAVSQIGYKGVSLDIKTSVVEELKLSHNTQKSDIEEADIIEAISRLQAKENAYKAALSATSRIMQLSLVDYL
ncbi:MAG: flagellar hook-associated protein FlgL [Desulfobacterales bacterium]|jgi:flagellar hook-associated protein 3|nr:flagellar hook-associated protein FlgL [Desulfobacterales bacterium]